MGTKYTTQTQSGFDASPPPDDGSVQASNKVTWAFVKTKLASPVLTLAQAINSALVTFTNFGSRAVTATDSVAVADHMKTIEAAGTFTESLPDATATGAGFIVSVKNTSTGVITVALTTATDTLNGIVNGTIALGRNSSAEFKTNAAATGYNTIAESISGTYTPVVSAGFNLAASTPYVTAYNRVGNTVACFGRIDVDPTAASAVSFDLSIPVASALTATSQAGGTFVSQDGGIAGSISASPTTDTVSFSFVPTSVANQVVFFQFFYQVL